MFYGGVVDQNLYGYGRIGRCGSYGPVYMYHTEAQVSVKLAWMSSITYTHVHVASVFRS